MTAQAAESTICPGHPSLVQSKHVKDACYTDVPDYLPKCRAVVQQLASIESPTIQQRFDLAEAQFQLGNLEDDNQRREELWAAAEHNYQVLHQSRPDDISVLFHLQLFLEDPVSHLKADGTRHLSEDFPYYHRMLTIAPDCSRVRKWLLRQLDFHPQYLSDIDQGWVDEISELLEDGYDLSREKLGRMEFAKMLYVSILAKNGIKDASAFRCRVFHELGIPSMEFDTDSRKGNLDAVCDYSAFHLQFTEYCLDAIRHALSHDIETGHPPASDVLEAIRKLDRALMYMWFDLGYQHPIEIKKFSFLEFPFFPHEAANYAVRLSDMVVGVPIQYQTFDLVRVSYSVLGENSKIKMLQQVIKNEPGNHVAQSWLSEELAEKERASPSR